MPGVENTFTADTWEQIRVKVVYAFDAVNGRTTINGVVYPRLSNAQALALLQAWRGQLAPRKLDPTTQWSLWYGALGYAKPGDKFDVHIAHGSAAAPDDVIAGAWEFVAGAAQRLDYTGASPKLLVLNFTYTAYEKAANDAYAALQRSRRKPKAKPAPSPTTTPDDVPVSTPEAAPEVSTPDRGTALLVVLVVIAIALRSKRK